MIRPRLERGDKMSERAKRIRKKAGTVMGSKNGYEVRDSIASALIDVAEAMEEYEKPKLLLRRNCIVCALLSTCVSIAVVCLVIYLLQ